MDHELAYNNSRILDQLQYFLRFYDGRNITEVDANRNAEILNDIRRYLKNQ